MHDKIHVVIRKDLDFGPQLAQAVHVAMKLERNRPEEAEYLDTENVVVLHAQDEPHLQEVLDKLEATPTATVQAFREPDYDNQLTAVAAWRGGRQLSQLPCAERKRKRHPH